LYRILLFAAASLAIAQDAPSRLKQAQSDLAAGKYPSAIQAGTEAADLFRKA